MSDDPHFERFFRKAGFEIVRTLRRRERANLKASFLKVAKSLKIQSPLRTRMDQRFISEDPNFELLPNWNPAELPLREDTGYLVFLEYETVAYEVCPKGNLSLEWGAFGCYEIHLKFDKNKFLTISHIPGAEVKVLASDHF